MKLLRGLTAVTVAAMLLPATAAGAAPTADDPRPAAAAAVGEPDGTVSPMIIGGRPASQVYKGLGSLQYVRGDDPHWHTCSVNLWDAWHAVTNAHCVTTYPQGTPYDPARYTIRFNSTDRLNGGITTGVKKIAVHPVWAWGVDPTVIQGDIAVLWLTKPVWTVPTALPPVLGPWPVRQGPARIAGWGFTAPPFEGATPQHLTETDLNIVDPSHCAAANIDAYEVCVLHDDPTISPCYGDSGGPVMTPGRLRNTWHLIGTASRETSPDCSGAAVYTSVVAFRGWINATIADRYVKPKPKRPTPSGPRTAYRWAGCGTAC
ncbi:S1 family peptidase [Phytohabitans kaempferiae]|uniref:Trypsin-like serine protease n=1 Tax=Phytohabitans kaempferiae TaxID=1620943 RepID=A0ABV6MBK5_9ACTN